MVVKKLPRRAAGSYRGLAPSATVADAGAALGPAPPSVSSVAVSTAPSAAGSLGAP